MSRRWSPLVQAVLGAAVLARYDDGNWYLSEFVRVLDRIGGVEVAGENVGGLGAGGTRSAEGMPAGSIRFENVTFTAIRRPVRLPLRDALHATGSAVGAQDAGHLLRRTRFAPRTARGTV